MGAHGLRSAAGCRPMSAGPRVLLMQLSERTSGKGNTYLSGWLGKASVAFAGEPDKHGNPTWDLFVSTPEPRAEAKSTNFGGSAPGDAAKPSARQQRPEAVTQRAPARPQERGDGWGGSQYRRPANGAQRASAADGGAFAEEGVDDLYR